MEEKNERKHIMQRFNVIFFMIFLLFVGIVLRLAYIQLVEGEKYVRASEELSFKPLFITAPRGWILDRNGEVLVNNKPVYTVTFLEENHKKEDLLLIAEKLENILMPLDASMNRVKILQKMDAGYRYRPVNPEKEISETEEGFVFREEEWELVRYGRSMPSYYPRRIMEDVPKEVMFYVAEHRNDLRGINVNIEPMRQYKKGAFATHILGYTNTIPARNVDYYLARGYRPDDKVGVSGLEQFYETQLRGIEGIRQVRVNSQAKTVETTDIVPPKRGNDLVLTIDWNYQEQVEKILDEELEKLRTRAKNPLPVTQAVAVVMNPKTGEIYAIANHPDYDLNIHQSPDFGKLYNELVAGREQNLAISGYYQPGSTIKMLSVIIGLEEKLIGEYDKLFSSGEYQVGNLIKKDWRTGGHGWVDARKALADSVNSYMFELAMRLANYPKSRTLYKEKFSVLDYYYSQFGLGVKTGIDLPNEKTGWRSPDKQLGRLADAMIGQYNAYTPIQIVQYVSTIANGGYRMRPYLVKEIRESGEFINDSGRVLMNREPEVLNKIEISPKTLKTVQEGMLAVTQGGTATRTFAGFPYKVAAKTGTVQTGTDQNNGLMVGYAPYEDPEIAFVVVVPKGGGGSDAAGPIARRILDAYYGLDKPVEVPTETESTPEPLVP